MAVSDVANDLTAVGTIHSYDVATVAVTFSNGTWTVDSQVLWEGARFSPPIWVFQNPVTNGSTTTIDVAQRTAAGTTAFTTEQILAYDGTKVLLGQPDGAGGYTQYYLVSDTTLQPGMQDFSYPITDLSTTGDYTAPPPACFAAGTRIRTARGEVAVENLVEGDMVAVQSAGGIAMKPVCWIGRRQLDITAHPDPEMVLPIRIRRNAFGAGQPSRNLLVSPDHAICVDGMLIPARLLVNGATITKVTGLRSIEYFHVELDEHAVLFADGLAAESYLDTGNRAMFQGAGKLMMLHPDFWLSARLKSRACNTCLPFVVDAAAVRPVWDRLAERATALGYDVPTVATDSDPALCLVAAGRVIEPVVAGRDRLAFLLPPDADQVRLVSRAARPCDTGAWVEDRRRLGVSVGRIVVRNGFDVTEIGVDNPALGSGWWAVEHAGVVMTRWTDGDALLAVPASGTIGRILELELIGSTSYPAEQPVPAVALQAKAA